MRPKSGVIPAMLLAGLVLFTLRIPRADVFLDGTQPGDLTNPLWNPMNCGCHAKYDDTAFYEPWDSWAGSMMSQAARDDLFWAALDIANQDIPEVGDLCIRCHSPKGWLEGRSGPPFDGSLLAGNDFEGVQCDVCHRMYEGPASQPYLENSQYWISDLMEKRGPYNDDTSSSHGSIYSTFHVDATLCGVCHNVTHPTINLVDATGLDTGLPMPVERTYKEWTQSDYSNKALPGYRNCAGCHMPAELDVKAAGSGDAPIRPEVYRHQLAGGNVWMMDVLAGEQTALSRGENFGWTRSRALDLLQDSGPGDPVKAATLSLAAPPSVEEGYRAPVDVTITNLTGHKLPTGYPEGRRMWIHLEAKDAASTTFFESGAYDPATAVLTHDEQVKVYEVKPGIYGVGPTFHFVLNNHVFKDNRIPPLGFVPDVETEPVNYTYPDVGGGKLANYDTTRYLIPVPLGTPGPVTVTVTLRYQTTSKEYIEFLESENTTTGRGTKMRQIWEKYGKCPPVDMVSGQVSIDVEACAGDPPGGTVLFAERTDEVSLDWTPAADTAFYRVHRFRTKDLSDLPDIFQSYPDAFTDGVVGDGQTYYYLVESLNGCGSTL